MPNLQLSNLANLALYGAMVALALAMLAFAVYVAFADRPRLRGAREAGSEGAANLIAGQAESAPAEAALVGAGSARSAGESAASAGLGRRLVPAGDDGAGAGADGVVAADSGAGESRARGARGARAGQFGMTLTWLTLMLLVVSVVARGIAVRRVPVANMFEFAVFGAMMALGLYLLLAMRRPLRWLGLFVVTPVLLVLGLALSVWYSPAAELLPSLQSLWLAIHVPIAVLSVAFFTVAFSVLLLQLARERHDARVADGRAQESFLDTLPSARTLDRIAYSLHIVAFPLWTFSVIAGAIWAQQAWGAYWNWDPKETWTFVIWVIYAAYLHARATSGWSRRTANILAALGYLAIIVNFAIVNVYFVGQHSYSGL
ncbi:MAG: c-type cytochrome biogenesis protein CcsB [Austwickia sp.]|jgi:cytochrome c-type biogenesis protein CcsB|nr:MAG: c-type cytochrome biogenesis protein CcsB [Austwickia sp.]